MPDEPIGTRKRTNHEQALLRILWLTEPGGDEFVEGICDIAEAALKGDPLPPLIAGEDPMPEGFDGR